MSFSVLSRSRYMTFSSSLSKAGVLLKCARKYALVDVARLPRQLVAALLQLPDARDALQHKQQRPCDRLGCGAHTACEFNTLHCLETLAWSDQACLQEDYCERAARKRYS